MRALLLSARGEARKRLWAGAESARFVEKEKRRSSAKRVFSAQRASGRTGAIRSLKQPWRAAAATGLGRPQFARALR
ncbi:MAG: hypothetical protein M3131_11060, partial [Actinomycetota bacterium]|nr:hypothetical protein [Actinomycetota bacterium]